MVNLGIRRQVGMVLVLKDEPNSMSLGLSLCMSVPWLLANVHLLTPPYSEGNGVI